MTLANALGLATVAALFGACPGWITGLCLLATLAVATLPPLFRDECGVAVVIIRRTENPDERILP